MKTIGLISVLDENQKRKFAGKIKHKSRTKLVMLFDFLIKNQGNPIEKKTLFKKVFNDEYTEEKDYLLRNELRLLNKELEFFIAENTNETDEPNKEFEHEIKLLTSFFENGQETLFETYFQEAITKATAKHNFEVAAQLYWLKAKFIFKYKEISIKNYRQAKQLLMLENEALHALMKEKMSENFVRQNFVQRVLQQLNSEENELSLEEVKKSLLFDASNLLVQYNQLIAKSYLQQGKQKIKTLQTASKIYQQVIAIREAKAGDIISIYGNIAVEYFLMEEFKTAHQYYQKAINSMPPDSANIEVLFNYCINGLAMGQPKIFIETAKTYQKQIAANNKLKHRFQYFTALAFLFEEKPKEAFRLLDHDISKRPENEYYFYRMVYAMAYFQLSDFDLAARELENILQSFRFRKPSENYDKPLVKAMQKLLAVHALRHQKHKFEKELKRLKEQAATLDQNVTRFSKTIYSWLNKQIEKL